MTTKRNLAIAIFSLSLVLVTFFNPAVCMAQRKIPAFPGAEGFGAYTVGGRGGKVMFVTNLNDSGPGSFREACQAEGPRIVIFRVSGIIELKSGICIRNPYITIAGQTAPGDGICLKNWLLEISSHQVIIRYMRVRPALMPNPRYDTDLPRKQGNLEYEEFDAISIHNSEDIIVDHCSVSWGNDETFSAVVSGGGTKLGNLTIQWCIISEGLDWYDHSMGTAFDSKDGGVSVHHNLYAHNGTRNPRLGSWPGYAVSLDFRNNVLYNWRANCGYSGTGGDDGEGEMYINYVGNYLKYGPSTSDGYKFRAFLADEKYCYSYHGNNSNYIYESPSATADNNKAVTGNMQDVPFPVPDWAGITPQKAQAAYQAVLAGVGATLPTRDAVDVRIINDVKNGTGKIINSPQEVGGWPKYKQSPSPADTDMDGMPDEWENKYKLNPYDNTDNNKDKDKDGYTNIEEFLNATTP